MHARCLTQKDHPEKESGWRLSLRVGQREEVTGSPRANASQMLEALPFTMCCDGEHFLRASPGLDLLPYRQAISAEHDCQQEG